MDSTLALIQSYARDRDAKAFAAIVKTYQGLVYRACLRIHRDEHKAEDSTQECFLLLARNAGKVTESLPGWLHRCATRVALGTVRSDNARRDRERVYGERAATVNATTEWGEISREVDEALDELPDDLREVLVEHFLCQRTQGDIAQDLGVSGATVSRRVDRAIKALQRNLKKAGVVATATILVSFLTRNAAAAVVPASLSAALGKLALAVGGEASAASVGTAVVGGTALSTTKVAAAAGVCIILAVGYMTLKPARHQSQPSAVEPESPPAEPVAVEPVEARPLETPAVNVDGAEVIVEFTFDGNDRDIVSVQITDPGLAWTVEDGTGRFAGTLVDDRMWRSGIFSFPVDIDTRAKLEISGEFRVASHDGYHLAALWAPPPPMRSRICMYYESQGRAPGDGHYIIQTRHMDTDTTLTAGSRSIPAFGNEADTFHRMRILLDRMERTLTYYVDETLIGVVSYEGDIAPITSVGMDLEVIEKGKTLDIRYDNIRIRSFGPIY